MPDYRRFYIEEVAAGLNRFGVDVKPEQIELVAKSSCDIPLRKLHRDGWTLEVTFARIDGVVYVAIQNVGRFQSWGVLYQKGKKLHDSSDDSVPPDP